MRQRCLRAFPQGSRLLPASQPGSWNGAAYKGFAARQRRIPGGFGSQTRPETNCFMSWTLFRLFATNIIPVLFFSCTPQDAFMHLKEAQRALHLFKIYRSTVRSQPGRNRLWEELAATKRSQVPSEKLLTVLSCPWFSSLSFSHVFLLVLINTISEAWLRILPACTRLYNVGVSRP